MKIHTIDLYTYHISMVHHTVRSGLLIKLSDLKKKHEWGDISPLPHYSSETLQQAINQTNQKKAQILAIDWTMANYLREIKNLNLYPSVLFGLESALLPIIKQIPTHSISTSALLMGTPQEILKQADIKKALGFTSAKLKIGRFTFDVAKSLINHLKDIFRLRIDINCAWNTLECLDFFSKYPKNAFDYIEEPFKNFSDLKLFTHPLAIDESLKKFSLIQLESLPTLKALIYKPTIRGGIASCLELYEWTKKMGIDFILSSSFESDLGLAKIAAMAYRLKIKQPIGIGTYDFLSQHICHPPIQFLGDCIQVPKRLRLLSKIS